MDKRQTIVVHGALTRAHVRAKAAIESGHGRQILTFEALACRLAGGFTAPIDDETLREAIQAVLPSTELGDFEDIKTLPGMVVAASDTLRKAWRAGLDLKAEARKHPRIAAMAKLERAVLERIPSPKLRPGDIAAKAKPRLHLAETLFESIRIVGITELSPCWRPLLHALATLVPVVWEAGPRPVPLWLDTKAVRLESEPAAAPTISCVGAANTRHETIEAMRWARRLLASPGVHPSDIAIASAIPADYDDDFLNLRDDSDMDLHFVHGVKVTATRDGQAAAALADVLLRGVTQSRIRRLSTLVSGTGGLFDKLPEGWTRVLPMEAPLSSPAGWQRLINSLSPSDWPDGKDHAVDLSAILGILGEGADGAVEAGEQILRGRPLKLWVKALRNGPAASIDSTIDALKQPDGLEPTRTVCWMAASELAASPRKHVRLLGLNAGRWPRTRSEDRLLADHIIEAEMLDPLPPAEADRRDFETILRTTETEIVLSRARRDTEGRLLGRSPLLQPWPEKTAEMRLRRNQPPRHAFSETDRVLARQSDFLENEQAKRGSACWDAWSRQEITPYDGLVRPDHPVIAAILEKPRSASSLRMLLRNPLGFVWKYGLHFKEPASGADPLMLNDLEFGNLVHAVLERALCSLEANGGIAGASSDKIVGAIETASSEVAAEWEVSRPAPPKLIWTKTLAEARGLARIGLEFTDASLPGARSFCESPFGGSRDHRDGELPWDSDAPVEIPGTGFHIEGRIDRIDLSADRRTARVRDYKTGRKVPDEDVILDGGKELQSCLYGFAVKALLGSEVDVSASLFFLRTGAEIPLVDPIAAMDTLANFLRLARASLLSGAALRGPDTGGKYDDLAIALPANFEGVYSKLKELPATERIGEAAKIWEVA